MSAFAYTPRFDGVLMDGRALPGRNPIDGQFHSSGPGLYAVDHDDELLDDCSSLELRLACFTSSDEPEEEEEDDVRVFESDVRPFDKYARLAEKYFSEEWRSETRNHFHFMAMEAGQNPYDFRLDETGDQAAIIEAWVQERYGFNECSTDLNTLDADEIGEQYEHLPHHIGRIESFRNHPSYSGSWSPEDWRGFYQSHGKRGRLNGVKLQKHRHIRSRRQQTDRQTDHLWMVEMTSDLDNFGRMTPEAFLDGFLDFFEIEEELRFLDERERELNDRFWRDHVSTDPITEAGQNCHGFGDRDPLEEDLFPEPEYRFDPILGRFVYVYGDDCPMDGWYDYPADEWDEYPDPNPPLTAAEWAAMEAEDLRRKQAEEAEAEALEFAFEHLAGGNAIGRRAQLALAAARV